MKNDLKYILLTFILLVGTLTAGAVGLAATGVSGEEFSNRSRTSLPCGWIP